MMGWGYAIVNGKEVGYQVEATCDYAGCNVKIDRGLGCACGGMHGDDVDSCELKGYEVVYRVTQTVRYFVDAKSPEAARRKAERDEWEHDETDDEEEKVFVSVEEAEE